MFTHSINVMYLLIQPLQAYSKHLDRSKGLRQRESFLLWGDGVLQGRL